MPTADFLDDLPPAPSTTDAEPVGIATTVEAGDGSLGIGALRVGG